MADRSGIGAQLGLAEEVTYGTRVAPARFLEFNSENINLQIARDESRGLRSTQRVLRSDHWKAGRQMASGTIDMEVGNKQYGVFFKHLLGAVTTTADGLGWKHSCAVGDLFNKSLSVQVGRPDTGGTVDPFDYLGVKMTGGTLSGSVDSFLGLQVSVNGQSESTAQTLAVATAPIETELFHWSGCTLTLGGTATPITDISLSIANGFKERFLMNAVTTQLQPVENQLRSFTGTFTPEWDANGLTNYARFTGGTTAAIVATWVCVTTYDTAKPFKIVVTIPAARFDGQTPNVTGEDVLMLPLAFKALDAGAGAITIDYYTSDATP